MRKNRKKTTSQYRITIIDTSTFEQKWKIKCTLQSIILWTVMIVLLLFVINFSLIFFTPIRNLITSSATFDTDKHLLENVEKIQNLDDSLAVYGQYLASLKIILSGDSSSEIHRDTSLVKPQYNIDNMSFAYKEDEKEFKARMEREEMYSLLHKADVKPQMTEFSFYEPVHGYISSKFDPSISHFGVDIVCKPDAMVHATLAGTVILANFSLETGYDIGIQHSDGYVTFYKHNSKLLKNVGDHVAVGDAISVVGNTGEETSGPHLHFELWKQGKALDPLEYINFEK